MNLNLDSERQFALNLIAVDCVILGFDGEHLNVLLMKRDDMETHNMKLPGHLVYSDETPDDAAERIMSDITGIEGLELNQFKTFSSVARVSDPQDTGWLSFVTDNARERVVTIAYFTFLRTENFKIKNRDGLVWVSVTELPRLAFDHNLIISDALDYFRKMVYFNNEFLFRLLPKKFTISQLRNLYEIVFRTKIDPGNFYKKVDQMSCVIPLEEKQRGARHRAARYFKYDIKVSKKGKL
ncbi:MAG: NrtR DNA-binding winged helix domain-containing protein [Candidatus Cryptobacteroides sp.]